MEQYIATRDMTQVHPAGSPVYVRFDFIPRTEPSKKHILRVQIAGLVEGAQYIAQACLTRGDMPVLKESSSVALDSVSTTVARVEYEVELRANTAHSLCLEVFDAKRGHDDAMTLLAVANRSVVISKETRQADFSALSVNTGFELVDVDMVGHKRSRSAEDEVQTPKTVKRPVNRQADVLKCIVDKPVTERAILEQCGDNRYTREILRRLMALGSVERVGRGGANDPFQYRFLCTPEEAIEQGREDPAVNIRMQRIEDKILALLGQHQDFVTEKEIRATVGDNTGTGKALRHLVKTSRVLRIGKGGVGDPFTYKACVDSHELSDCSTISSSKSSTVDVDEVHTDEENQVAHTLALLAAGTSPACSSSPSDRCSRERHGAAGAREARESDDRNAASIYDMYIAAAAALDSTA